MRVPVCAWDSARPAGLHGNPTRNPWRRPATYAVLLAVSRAWRARKRLLLSVFGAAEEGASSRARHVREARAKVQGVSLLKGRELLITWEAYRGDGSRPQAPEARAGDTRLCGVPPGEREHQILTTRPPGNLGSPGRAAFTRGCRRDACVSAPGRLFCEREDEVSKKDFV